MMTDAYDRNEQMIRAEVAAEILNNVRGIIIGKAYEIESGQPEESDRLYGIARNIYKKQRAIDFEKVEEVEAIIQEWGPLLKGMVKGGEAAFWKHVNGEGI